MMLHVPGVLTPDEVNEIRTEIAAGPWVDGARSAGVQAVQAKRNLQLSVESALAREMGERIRNALLRHPLFVSAALPHQVLQPMFNAYSGGGTYGNHVDSAIHIHSVTAQRVRTDVSTTVFLCDPEEYEGGELIVEDAYGAHEVKLPAGDAIVYPSTSLHRVEPVTAGTRLASFLWTQSMVRDDWRRHMLFDLDMTILRLRGQLGDSADVIALTSHYHNLLRQWAET
jgi:PKHD-type hydroxylase